MVHLDHYQPLSSLPPVRVPLGGPRMITIPEDDRHKCFKCLIVPPQIECSTCFTLLCSGCMQRYGHNPEHELHFHHAPGSKFKEPLDVLGVARNHYHSDNSPHNVSMSHLHGKGQLSCGDGGCGDCRASEDDGDVSEPAEPRFWFKKAFKSVLANDDAYERYSRNVMVCLSCDYTPIRLDNMAEHKNQGHEIITPETAMERLQLRLTAFFEHGISLVKRNDESQYSSIQMKNGSREIAERSLHHIDKSYEKCVSVLKEQKSQITKALNSVFEMRAEELAQVDEVLFAHKERLDSFEETLEGLIKLSRTNKAAAINGWRKYCKERDTYDIAQATKLNAALTYPQCGGYLENMEALIRSYRTKFSDEIQKSQKIIEEHIRVSGLKTRETETNIRNNDLVTIETLREAHAFQKLLQLPLRPSANTAASTVPYYAELGQPMAAAYFKRVDTFHPKWEKVYVAVYGARWLAIYSDCGVEKGKAFGHDQPTRGFKENVPIAEGNSIFRRPPENILPLSEIRVNRLVDNSEAAKLREYHELTPVSVMMEKSLNMPALEIVRIVNGIAQGWWILADESQELISTWHTILKEQSLQAAKDDHAFPQGSSKYVPSTNPGIRAAHLGIDMPPVGNRWAATHLAQAEENYGPILAEGEADQEMDETSDQIFTSETSELEDDDDTEQTSSYEVSESGEYSSTE